MFIHIGRECLCIEEVVAILYCKLG
jgi:hypothetical protein